MVVLTLALLLPVLTMLSYNTYCFGGPLSMGYHHEVSPMFKELGGWQVGFRAPRAAELWEILFGAYRGLFRGSPFLLLVIPAVLAGLVRFSMDLRLRGWVLVCGCIVCVTLLANASMTYWTGGAAAGPRFLVPALPFWVLLLAGLPRALQWVTIPLVAVSIGLMVATTAVNPEVPVTFQRPWSQYTWQQLSAGEVGVSRQTYQDDLIAGDPEVARRAAFNWGEKLGLPGLWSVLPLACVWVLLWCWFVWKRNEDPPDIARA